MKNPANRASFQSGSKVKKGGALVTLGTSLLVLPGVNAQEQQVLQVTQSQEQLEEYSGFEGVVVDAITRKPISGVEVELWYENHPIGTYFTAKNGHYTFTIDENKDAEAYSLFISKTAYETHYVAALTAHEVSCPEIKMNPLNEKIEQGVVLQGRVVNGYDEPVAKAEVSVHAGEGVWLTTETSEIGTFRFEIATYHVGTSEVYVRHEGQRKTLYQVSPEEQLEIVLGHRFHYHVEEACSTEESLDGKLGFFNQVVKRIKSVFYRG